MYEVFKKIKNTKKHKQYTEEYHVVAKAREGAVPDSCLYAKYARSLFTSRLWFINEILSVFPRT